LTLHDAWNAEADRWAAWARTPDHDGSYAFQAPLFLDLLPPPGRLTLDVGCGEGRLTRDLTARGHRVVGADVAPRMIELAAEADPEGEYVVADAADLPFEAGAFDLGVAFMSLHDMENMAGAVREVARVLEPGARMCAAVVHPLAASGAFEGDDPDAPFVVRESYLERKRWRETLERRGLAITLNSVHPPLGDYARALEDAGFLLEALREPTPPDSIVARDEAWRRWRRIPMFLHLRAVRP
jgi:SAM-dependent methyltransferase